MTLIVSISYAQETLEYKRIKAKYAGEQVIKLNNSEQLDITLKEGKVHVNIESYLEKMYMDNTAGLFSEGSVDYSDFGKILKIEAGTLLPNNNKYKTVPVKDFTKSEKISNHVFYDGSKNISFLYPSLQKGAKSYLKLSKEITEPRLIPSYFFQENSQVVTSEYKVVVAKDVDIDFRLFNISDTAVSFNKTVNKNTTSYSWKINNVAKYKYEAGAPDFYYSTPHIAVWVKSYKFNGQVHNILNSLDDLYKWYYSHTKKVDDKYSTELRNIVDSLIKNETVEIEKVKKIYYWVQENIKYIAFEDGMAGFVPRSASQVCAKRYGDCKDMANIIKQMLSYAQINAHLTWIGSNSLPYTYKQLPTPSVANHMITTYINNGTYYFLDATGKKTPLEIPTDFIQGKDALISIDSNHYEIKKVTVVPFDATQLVDSVNIVIDQNTIYGSGNSLMTGYEHISLYLKLYGNTEDTLQILRDYYRKGNNKFLVTSNSISQLDERNLPVVVKYTFNIVDYVKRIDDEVYINMNLDKKYQHEDFDINRVLSFQKDNKELLKSTVTLKIPKGYSLQLLPKNSSYKNDFFGFDINYSSSKNTITLNKSIYINFLLLEKSNFAAWNDMIHQLNKVYQELVSLKQLK